jgi:hypothetical protein
MTGMDVTLNFYAAWIAIFVGILSGMVTGLFFHKEDFLGGYESWPRRLMRLGHISFFGLGILNLLFALTSQSLEMTQGETYSSKLLVIGLITMPLVCYVAAFAKKFRVLFFIPVLSVLLAVGIFIWRIFQL